MHLLQLAVLLPFLGAIIVPIIYYYTKRLHPGYVALLFPVSAAAILISLRAAGQHISSMNWMPHIGLNLDFHLDGFAFLFTMLITVIGTLVIFYSISYLGRREALGHFYCYLLIFMGAMLGVVLSDNVIALYLFWELTSISSFLLISFWNHKSKSIQGALKSMLITVFGGLMLLGGLLSLVAITHTFSIREMIAMRSEITASPLFTVALLFILLAAFTKSAQFPFHIWLPDAMEAPTPVSAYLHSATMVKAGIYLVARFTPIFAVSSLWIYAVTFAGAITLFWASYNAVKQRDLKGVLAYSTISQLGLMMTLLGIGGISLHFGHDEIFYMSIVACVFHIFNHASFKGALFMVVGIIDHETGTRDLRKLSGLLHVMPLTFTAAAMGALSMAGVPPFNGFLSKEMFLTSMFDSSESALFNPFAVFLLLALVIIGSLFTFIYSIKLVKDIFFGQRQALPKEPHEAPLMFLASPFILISIVIITGLIPNILTPMIESASSAVLNKPIEHIHISHWHGINPALLTTLAIFIVGTLMVFAFDKWKKIYQLQPEHFTFNTLYQDALQYSERIPHSVNSKIIRSGSRLHVMLIFGTLILLTIAAFLMNPIDLGKWQLAEIRIHEVILVVIILIATYMVLIAKSRIFSIIMLSAIGYSVGLFFVFFNAPDIALTQLTIETISTALFLMCFFHLPKLTLYGETAKFKISNAVVAILSGLAVIVISLVAYGHRFYPSINEYYIKNVYELAAGKNMVNVILVDFRGFDTLFESSVLGIAGIGIYTLIKLRYRKDDEHEETKK
ncbi:Na+/H+ antiporter subunit A [Macrococcus hajekii]|uniref:Na(+)/H(+) antiporter subunit A1 n=1 Tax=Macrococcus hajekii TaxID=198482 RepID=A0A4R6BNN0_9STAP|nr:Na+/H+ antiporter subunit A [Macrococcus hajekii]TDM03470.1 Na+/H+ antiporter subunit A [Macrococcus hajekii]GGA99142.1 Na(+)/H(+) antiporter subunit A1 [Macrococcus hajekii]